MSIDGVLLSLDHSFSPVGTARTASRAAMPKPGMMRRFMLGSVASAAVVAAGLAITDTSVWPARQAEVGPVQSIEPAATALPPMAHVCLPACELEMRDWAAFRARFLHPEGRVVDTYDGGSSHTESQGLGMLFAVAFDDRETFQLIWDWTSKHLARANDALHSWKYVPGSATPVPDDNNATDGDIYIAAALVRASSRWGSEAHLASARAIARDLLALTVRQVGGRTVLLPAAEGFLVGDGAVINASYYIFPLLTELAAAHPSPVWARLLADGRDLIDQARFGRFNLPSDWIQVSARGAALEPADGRPPRFSFDAVRIPLFLSWDRAAPARLRRFAEFWGPSPAGAPAWVDVRTGGVAPYPLSNGVVAIARLAGGAPHAPTQASLPAIAKSDEYYSSALILLSRLALRETAAAATT